MEHGKRNDTYFKIYAGAKSEQVRGGAFSYRSEKLIYNHSENLFLLRVFQFFVGAQHSSAPEYMVVMVV